MGNAIGLEVRRAAANEAAVISSWKRLLYDFIVTDFSRRPALSRHH